MPFNTQQFLIDHPEVISAFNDPSTGVRTSYGTLDNFALAHAAAWGTPEEKAAANGAQVIGSGGQLINNPRLLPNTVDNNPFGTNGLGSVINSAVNQGAQGAADNPNTKEVMGAIQNAANQSSGITATTGTQNQQGTQTGQTNQNQTTTGTQAGLTSGSQAGTTIGNTSNLSQGTNFGTTIGNTTGQVQGTQASQQIGNTTGQVQGTQASQQIGQLGTSGTTSAIDTLGFGQLLKDQVGSAQSSTNAQQKFLTDLVSNGPANQQALTARAVNQALSGPQMVGAGNEAQSRTSSDAAATVGANSLNQQLTAAQLLANPTQVTNLAIAANPYVGQATTGQQTSNNTGLTNTGQTTFGTSNQANNNVTNQTTSGTSNQANNNVTNQANTGTSNQANNNVTNQANTGTTDQATTGISNQATSGTNTQNLLNSVNSLNLSSLLNDTKTNTNEQQAGTSQANSAQVGVGTVPTSVQKSSGGCYVCTDFVDRGLMKPGAVRRAARWKLSQKRFRKALVGYSVYGPIFAKYHLVPHTVARLILHEECRLAGVRVKLRLDAIICHAVFHFGSVVVAVLTGHKEVKQCDASTLAMLSRNNLNFEV